MSEILIDATLRLPTASSGFTAWRESEQLAAPLAHVAHSGTAAGPVLNTLVNAMKELQRKQPEQAATRAGRA
jgi:hypothetical protein